MTGNKMAGRIPAFRDVLKRIFYTPIGTIYSALLLDCEQNVPDFINDNMRSVQP